ARKIGVDDDHVVLHFYPDVVAVPLPYEVALAKPHTRRDELDRVRDSVSFPLGGQVPDRSKYEPENDPRSKLRVLHGQASVPGSSSRLVGQSVRYISAHSESDRLPTTRESQPSNTRGVRRERGNGSMRVARELHDTNDVATERVREQRVQRDVGPCRNLDD